MFRNGISSVLWDNMLLNRTLFSTTSDFIWILFVSKIIIHNTMFWTLSCTHAIAVMQSCDWAYFYPRTSRIRSLVIQFLSNVHSSAHFLAGRTILWGEEKWLCVSKVSNLRFVTHTCTILGTFHIYYFFSLFSDNSWQNCKNYYRSLC